MKPNYESYSDYYQTEYELKLNKMEETKKVPHNEVHMTLKDQLIIHDLDKSKANKLSNVTTPIVFPLVDIYFIDIKSEKDYLLIQTDSGGNYLVSGHDYKYIGNKDDADRFINNWKNLNN